jgi:opacity protein-like surface antigen
MRSWVIAGIGVAFLTGNALSQSSGTYVTNEIGSFLPSTLNAAQSSISQSESRFTGKPYRSAYGYDFGNGFKTEIEDLSSNAASERLGGLAASGNLTTTRVTLKGMYELSDGVWRVKPYVGAGLGMIDVNEQILGVTRDDWAAAYQLRGGVSLGFTQKLVGSLEYRWTDGSKPSFSLAGIPTKLEVDRHSFVVGVNYKY